MIILKKIQYDIMIKINCTINNLHALQSNAFMVSFVSNNIVKNIFVQSLTNSVFVQVDIHNSRGSHIISR